MRYLFNSEIYPLVTSEDDLAYALRQDYTRAVSFRDPQIKNDLDAIKEGIEFVDDMNVAAQYRAQVCPHYSSQYIPSYGQAAALFTFDAPK